MKFRHLSLVVALGLGLALLLTGCMNDNSRTTQNQPTAAPDYMPEATVGPSQNNGTGNGSSGMNNTTGTANGNGTADGTAGNNGNTSSTAGGALTPFDWANGAAQIETAINRISEIAESRVVVTNTTALVGVRFDNVYKGQLTERIRQMVAAEVLRADPGIQTVAVTSEPADVEKVYSISDQIRAGRTSDELSQDINAIVRNATTMR